MAHLLTLSGTLVGNHWWPERKYLAYVALSSSWLCQSAPKKGQDPHIWKFTRVAGKYWKVGVLTSLSISHLRVSLSLWILPTAMNCIIATNFTFLNYKSLKFGSTSLSKLMKEQQFPQQSAHVNAVWFYNLYYTYVSKNLCMRTILVTKNNKKTALNAWVLQQKW